MVILCTILIFLVSAWQIINGLQKRGGTLEFPFLVTWVFLLWMLPQAIAVSKISGIPEEAVDRLFGMMLLCFVGLIMGFQVGRRKGLKVVAAIDFISLRKLAVVSILFGAVFAILLKNVSEEELASSNWSGRTVAFLFLSQPMFYGGALSLALYLRKKDKVLLVFGACALLVVLGQIVVGGRRGPLVQFGLATGCILYFLRGFEVPKAIFVVCIFVAAIFTNGIGIYRKTVYDGQQYGTNIDIAETGSRVVNGLFAVLEKYDELLLPTDCPEVLNATMFMQTIENANIIDFGTDVWDHLVHTFFPGQILGRELKAALQINWFGKIYKASGHKNAAGSTVTGLTDAYQSFRWLGFIKFFFVGYIMGFLWTGACRGDFLAQLAYACLLRPGLEAITHSTPLFYMGVINFAVLLGIFIYIISRQFEKKLRRQQDWTRSLSMPRVESVNGFNPLRPLAMQRRLAGVEKVLDGAHNGPKPTTTD